MDEEDRRVVEEDAVVRIIKKEKVELQEEDEDDELRKEGEDQDDEDENAPSTSDAISISASSPPPGMDDGSSSEIQSSDNSAVQSTSSNVPPSSSRLMRNLAEKMRRDKLNMYISELSSLVPIVAMATKRMDKTSVLRLSANFLRIHLSLKQNRKEKERPKLAPEGLEASLSSALLEAMEGFMLIVTSLGKIVFVSESVEKLLGHSQLDLMGQSLYTVCHNGDHELLRHHLQPSAFESKEKDAGDSADYVPRSPSFFGGKPEDALSGLASGERRSFYVRLTERSMARGDPARHVTVHLIGYLRPPNHKKDPKKGKKECSSTSSSGDEHLLVCVARPFRNKGITELSLMEAVQDEYVTRHLPDGRIIYSDHRIAFIAGYLTEEVMGLSAFNFIHQDDLPWATVANRQMFSSVEGQGYSVYRLRSKTGSLIYLRTRGFLEFNKTTQKVETFVCINTLLTSEEGDKELEKERQRIQPFITFQQVTTTSTNMGLTGSNNPALTSSSSPSSSLKALPSPIDTAGTTTSTSSTTVSIRHRKEKPLTMIFSSIQTQVPAAAIASSPGAPSVPPPFSSPPISAITFGNDLTATSPASVDSMIDVKSVLSPTDLISSVTPLPGTSAESPTMHLNGDTIKEELPSPGSLVIPQGSTSPLLSPTSTLSLTDVELTQTLGDQQNGKGAIELPLNGNLLGATGTMTRLKRSFSEVDPVVTDNTSSPKRPIVPSAFISTYNPIHHSSPLGTKWGSETTTTIIFDQHNNNG